MVTRRCLQIALTTAALTLAALPLYAEPEAEAEAEAPAAEAAAQPAVPATPAVPRIHHAPISTAPAHEPLVVRADIEHPQLVRRALLVYRVAGEADLKEIEFARASEGPYAAIIPEGHVLQPSLAYAIELEPLTGPRIAAFASRARMHDVQVPEDLMDERERALLTRLGGRRSVFRTTGEYVSFGRSEASQATGAAEKVQDYYWRVEGGYTYRPLRVITEFSVRAGVVRGKAPVPVRDLAPGASESDRYDVGLNYGAPSVRFRLHDQVHLEGEALLSVTEIGFSAGGGSSLHLGDPYGSKLVLGFETVHIFGSRFYSRMDVVASNSVIVAPIIEVTNMPSAEDYGVRLLGEVAFDAGSGFSLAARGGYQARLATSGGPAFGAALAYAF